jgi:uncharacterized protein YukE
MGGVAEGLDELARRLEGLAGRTEDAGEQLRLTVVSLPWQGEAAAAFRRRAEVRRREIREDAEALRHAAGQVRKLAGEARSGPLAGLLR